MNKIENQNDVIIELIKISPNILWVIFGFVVFYYIYKALVKYIFPHMKFISAYGVEIHLLKTTMNSIIKVAEKNKQWNINISEEDKNIVINRVQSHSKIFDNTSILWFDDRPETLNNEIKMFSQLGVEVKQVETLSDALQKIKNKNFDILISDIDRGTDKDNGIETLKDIVKHGYTIPSIFYIGEYSNQLGTPPYAFGITNRPDELLHLVIDILERK